MIATDTGDITAYYTASRSEAKRSFDELLNDLAKPFERWPIRNREPREPISSQKRAIIHERDGGECQLCATIGHVLTVDHIIPRSTFAPDELAYADRSDNLHSACWPCNERKSNYESIGGKRLGVVTACWDCLNPGYHQGGEYENEPLPESLDVLVYCGRCGVSTVPRVEGWVL